MGTTVATANVLYTLSRRDAAGALGQVLAERPDLVALQEWYVPRLPLLRRSGGVDLEPGPRVPGGSSYHWVESVLSDTVVGARADRYDVLSTRSTLISGFGRTDRSDRLLALEPPRFVAVGVFRDRLLGGTVALLSYHLTPGVQRHGHYRQDRARLVARHQREVHRVEALVAELEAAGHVVYAAGDSNFDGFRLAGLTSAWDGREDHPGTFGGAGRKIDDVHGPGPVDEVRLLTTASDHKAVVAVRSHDAGNGPPDAIHQVS